MRKKILFTFILAIFLLVLASCSAPPVAFKYEAYAVKIGGKIVPEVHNSRKNNSYTLAVGNETIAAVHGNEIEGLRKGITKISAISGDFVATATLIVSDLAEPGGIVYGTNSAFNVSFHLTNPDYRTFGLESDVLESGICLNGDTYPRDLPVYLGYDVHGWYSDPQCTVPFDTRTTPITADTRLYCVAVSRDNTFTVDGNGMVSGLLYKNLPHAVLTLPEVINGREIVGIAPSAFANDTLVREVRIPACYESIGNFAFAGCTNLHTVRFEEGSNLKKIGKFAFGVTAETENEADEEEEPTEFVSGENPCIELTDINLPDGVTEIGAFAFGYCNNLKLSGIPSGLTVVEYGAFAKTRITDVNLANVTNVRSYAFLGCDALITVRNTSNVTHCGTDAFSGTALFATQANTAPYVVYADTIVLGCHSSYGRMIGGRLNLPEKVTLIADNAFAGSNQCELTVFFPHPGGIIGTKSFLTGEGVCLATASEADCAAYKEAVRRADHGEYAPRFCERVIIRVDEDENAPNYGEHTLLKFSSGTYAYDLFTRINSTSAPDRLKSPEIIDLSLLPVDKITRINVRAIAFGTYVSDGKEHYGGNLTTLIMPRNLTSMSIFAVSQCGKLAIVDMRQCFAVPKVVSNSIQFTSVGTETAQGTKILVSESNFGLYRSEWADAGIIRERLTTPQ